MESDVVSGQQSTWVLLKKLGEGDAGEVYLVETLLDKQTAILKRPVRSAFASDVIRQTSQITTEGKILRSLSEMLKMDADFSINVPNLLDQSRPGTAFSDRLFIVIEKARGFDLAFLARAVQLGSLSGADLEISAPEEKRFLQTLAESGHLPERILLCALSSLLSLFEKIHTRPLDVDGVEVHGILWNDVKPEHLFWDPWRSQITIIDWGNGQLLGRDGTTRDRRFSAVEDYRQFIDEMGRFLENAAPALVETLAWPDRHRSDLITPATIQALQERIWETLQEQEFDLEKVRQQEAELLRRETLAPAEVSRKKTARQMLTVNPLAELEDLHRQIISFGEMPDYTGALSLAMTDAARFASQDRLDDVQHTCEWADGLPGVDSDHLHLVSRLANITARADAQGATGKQHLNLSEAVENALKRSWPDVLWNLVSALDGGPEPDWWHDLITTVRRLPLGKETGSLQPVLLARRALLTLQSMAERLDRAGQVDPAARSRLAELIRQMREEVVPNWVALEPNPPYSNLSYQEIDSMLDDIGDYLPDARLALDNILDQPREQARRVLENWEKGEFRSAAEGLRQILLWDPDRKRVLRAEQAIANAPHWLAKVHQGPPEGVHYQAFISEVEFEGRELRNQVGPAGWLDLILEGCRQLRRGAWPPDLFIELPLLVREMAWLRRYERRERLPAELTQGEPEPELIAPAFALLSGTGRGKVGTELDLQFLAPLDGWVPEARGSSARVFSGLLRDARNTPVQAAIKLMRMDKVDYALPLFKEEVLVLNVMRSVPGVTPMLECGFLKLDGKDWLPAERSGAVDPGVSGSLMRIGPVAAQDFLNQVEARIEEGWTPYLALEQRDSRQNLLPLCDSSMTGGNYLPVSQLLLIAIQICDILQEAHQRNVVYRDHKILHYYWIEAVHGVFSIDWNVARLHPEGLSAYEKQMDLVQFGARGLHHIMTGRPAPGALPLGPTRPEEIEQAAKSYQAQWTYDDQRLPEDLRAVLERVLAGEYNNVTHLKDDLKSAFLNLPDV